MKRLLIPFGIALGLSLGMSTGAVIVRQRSVVAATAAQLRTQQARAAKRPVDSTTKNADVASHGIDSVAGRAGDEPSNTSAAAPAVAAPTSAGAVGTAASSHVASEAPSSATGSAAAPALPVRTAGSATPALQHPRHPDDADSGHVSYLAKTFATMPSRAAAGVMMGMPDEDITLILSSMNAKQRGAILGSFPSDRATKVARLMLRSPSTL